MSREVLKREPELSEEDLRAAAQAALTVPLGQPDFEFQVAGVDFKLSVVPVEGRADGRAIPVTDGWLIIVLDTGLSGRVIRTIIFHELVEALHRTLLFSDRYSEEAVRDAHRKAVMHEEAFRGKIGLTVEEEQFFTDIDSPY